MYQVVQRVLVECLQVVPVDVCEWMWQCELAQEACDTVWWSIGGSWWNDEGDRVGTLERTERDSGVPDRRNWFVEFGEA